MKKILSLALALCLLVSPVYGTNDYARRFPTDTAIPVVTPAVANATYLRLDCTNDPLTGQLDSTSGFLFTGHGAIGTDGSVGTYTLLDFDETLTFVDTTGYGIFADLYLEPAGALSAATHLVAMDMQAQWNGAVDGSTHASVQGIKGEGVNRAAAQPINQLIGVYGKVANLGVSVVTEAIAVLGNVTNDDALGTELGDLTTAYSFLARAFTDKGTGVIGTRHGLYIEDTTGGGLLTNQYGIYIEDMASGSASGTTYAIYSLGGNVDFTDGTIDCKDITLDDFASGSETIDEILDDMIHADVLDAITITDEGGINISWTVGEIWDYGNSDIVDTDVQASTGCADNSINYLFWDRSGGGTALTLSTTAPDASDNDVAVATINCADGDIYELNTIPIYSKEIPTLIEAFQDIFPSIIASGLIVSEHAGDNAFDVDMTGGTYYVAAYGKEVITNQDSTTDNLIRWYQSGAGAWTAVTGQTEIDEANYNTGNALVDITGAGLAAKYFRSLFFINSKGINWVYPTTSYITKAAAIAGADPALPAGLTDHPKSTVLILQGNDIALPDAVTAAEQWIDVRPILGNSISGDFSDHGNLTGLGDDDHTQYILHSLADAANDFLVASGADVYVKKTLAETGAILEGDIDHGNLQGLDTGADHSYIDQDVTSGSTPTFTATNITGVPAASILAGTFGSGAYVFDNTVTGITTLECNEVENSGADLAIQPDAGGDINCFGTTDVDNGVDGKSVYVHRKAAEGDTYLRIYGEDNKDMRIDCSGGNLQLNTGGGKLKLQVSTTDVFNIYSLSGYTQTSFGLEDGTGNLLVITNDGHSWRDFGKSAQTNPTLYVTSDTDWGTATDEWISFTHNVTDAVIGVGKGKLVVDADSVTECLRLASTDSVNDYADLYVDADSILWLVPNSTSIGGVAVSGKFTQTSVNATAAGPTDNFNVGAANVVLVSTNGNNVTIGGFINGYDGQVIHVTVTDATNNATLEHAEGTGNQDIYLSSGADETRTASYGGWTLVCNGTHWYEVGQ